MQPPPTKATIGTHSGNFHLDEVLGCMLLRRFTAKYQGATIIRTRDPAVLAPLDIVIDVGGNYNPESSRLDHHQKEFQTTWSDKYPDIRMSSAGLVFKHHGKEVIPNAIDHLIADTKNFKTNFTVEGITMPNLKDPNIVELIMQRLYKNFFAMVDAIDNGVEAYPADIKPKYRNSTDIAARVGRMNPPWFDAEADTDEAFHEAMKIAEDEFLWQLYTIAFAWLPGRALVEEAVKTRKEFHPSGAIILLKIPCPWKDHVFELEKELGIQGQILYVLFPGKDSNRIQCVGVEGSAFGCRLALPKEWRGLSNEKLSEVAGIPDGVFCHHSGFIGGAKSFASTIKMAELSLQQQKP